MKIRAIHEIVYFDGERKTIAPGTVVDVDSEILKHFPEGCYAKAGSADTQVDDQDDNGGDDNGPVKYDAKALGKMNKAKLTEIATGLGIEVADQTNAQLVTDILAKQDAADDELV